MPENVEKNEFWKQSDYATKEYVDSPLTDHELARVEEILGYKLPAAYAELCRGQNGGIPKRNSHRMKEPTSWAKDHIALTGIFAIGSRKSNSLCGPMGSQFWIDEWGYPPIGVYFADTPSGGHDLLCLDYGECGPKGDPVVVHVDQELDYRITHVADTFADFIAGLEFEESFEIEEGDSSKNNVVSNWSDLEPAREHGHSLNKKPDQDLA